ncbi:MAG: hypothetical protein LUC92_01680 [Clostridiales bacterium]|nr:hypothetical protein [Clostridiales bacterium]
MISLYSQEEIYEMYIRDLKKESRAESKEAVAIEMLKENEDLSKISKYTHLSLEKINEIKARLSSSLQLASE